MFAEIDFLRFLSVSITSLIIFCFYFKSARTIMQKLFICSGSLGLYIVCGFGYSYNNVTVSYFLFYTVFFILVFSSFIFTCKLLGRTRNNISNSPANLLNPNYFKPSIIYIIIGIFLLFKLFPLLYPSLRLNLLFNPPRPDIISIWNSGMGIDKDFLRKLIDNLSWLIYPFYLISLYKFRRNYLLLGILIIAPSYFEYCDLGYVGRSYFIYTIMLYGLATYLDNPRLRKRIAVVAFCTTIPIFIAFGIYGQARGGISDYKHTSVTTIVQNLIYSQTSFPTHFQMIYDSNKRVNIYDYLKWIATLPIPKLLIGEKTGARINVEIAEIIEGIGFGEKGFTVTLSGPISESIYIFGPSFFWLHAIFVGFLFAFLCSITESLPSLLFVTVYFALNFGYVFARAGIGGTLPTLTNQFISLYFAMLFLYFNRNIHIKNTKSNTKTYNFRIG